MANTKISALTATTTPTWNEELVYALNNANGKMTLNTMKTYANTWQQAALVSGVNIKTINNTSILWSWNIDVSWWWWGGFEPTELSGDANIWELSEWAYVTTYDLYYKSWEKVPAAWSLSTKNQMIFVVEETSGDKWFLVYSVSSSDSWYASYWYSKSSSVGKCFQLWSRDWCLKQYNSAVENKVDSLQPDNITQYVTNAYGIQDIELSTSYPPFVWVTYTIIIASVQTANNYQINLTSWVTNPFWITLPTSSTTKKCVITLIPTSTTTAIITWCTIEP